MDFVFGALAAALWLAVWGMARGCARLQRRRDAS
jgi:hypothetical protein